MSQSGIFRVQRNTYTTRGIYVPQAAPVPRLPLFISLTALVFLGALLPLLTIITTVRLQPIAQPVILPQSLAPGQPVLAGVACYTPPSEYAPRCAIDLLDWEAYFDFDAHRTMIMRVLVPMSNDTLGTLIVAWGTPTGIVASDYQMRVFWGTRSVLLYTTAPKPDSRVSFIQYDLEQPTLTPWRGLRRYE